MILSLAPFLKEREIQIRWKFSIVRFIPGGKSKMPKPMHHLDFCLLEDHLIAMAANLKFHELE